DRFFEALVCRRRAAQGPRGIEDELAWIAAQILRDGLIIDPLNVRGTTEQGRLTNIPWIDESSRRVVRIIGHAVSAQIGVQITQLRLRQILFGGSRADLYVDGPTPNRRTLAYIQPDRRGGGLGMTV